MPKTGELRAYFDELYGATVSADMAKKVKITSLPSV